MPRNRPTYMALILITITLGLFTRSSYMPAKDGFIASYSGDVLWATLIYLLFSALSPHWSPLKVSLYALAFSFAIEFSQFNQQEWIHNIRQTRLGALILGHRFLASDLICYSVGVLIPYIIEISLFKKQNSST